MKGGSKLIYDFLKETKVDFSTEGGPIDEPITMDRLLELSKLVGAYDDKPGTAMTEFSRATYFRGLVGPRFGRAMDGYLHGAFKLQQAQEAEQSYKHLLALCR